MKFLLALISKIFYILTMLSVLLSSFPGCEDKEDPKEDPTPENVIEITDFTIVRSETADELTVRQTVELKNSIKEYVGADLTVATDESAEGEKEIVVGLTERASTEAALTKLKKQTSSEAYIIDISENKIVITGTTEQSTVRAIKIFVEKYVKVSEKDVGLNVASGKTFAKNYHAGNVEILANGVEIEILQEATTILASVGSTTVSGTLMNIGSTHYPSIVQLQHQPDEKNNGKLITHICLSDSRLKTTSACFMESDDGGKTWNLLSRPTEQNPAGVTAGLKPGQMSHIYELPAQVGDYPAGTLVFASGSINYDVRSEIWMWYSTDCGKTWMQTAKIANGGTTEAVGDWPKQSGVWEPFAWYDSGYLYCFYSDDSDPTHDQKLVYKRSRDGVNWESLVEICAFDNPVDRPGMLIMTKMGNGEYFIVYEFYGVNDAGQKNKSPTAGEIYYKKTSNIADWGDPADKGTLLSADGYCGIGAPSCVWVPAGGECGTLIVSAKKEVNGDGTHRLFVSFDYGKTWTTMKNPLPYETGTDNRIGHSSSFVVDPDGRTVYYVCTTNVPETGKRRIQFASFVIY